MKLSEQWLRGWVNPPITAQALAEQLTMAGLEVDSVLPAAPAFSGVVVGLVQTVVPHPNADRLRLCTVKVGDAQSLEVVCGASNVRADLKVAVARIGALLPNNFKITESKIRGVVSQGMICSARELGLSDESEGIIELLPDAPIGINVRDYLKLDDHIIEIELTPNRGDCLSVQGVARELAAINSLGMLKLELKEQPAKHQESISVVVSQPEACPRYVGRVIRRINTHAQTPVWMQEHLRRSGLKCIYPVVDVMNYVMLELGQPLHAFDLSRLQGNIDLRFAHEGEKIKLLDGQEIVLKSSSLVVSDQQKAQAIAGIMGGLESAITASTEDLFLESAFFDPITIGVEARRYALQSDACYRFERGVDPELSRLAMIRASELLLQIVGGELGPITEVVHPEHLPARAPVSLSLAEVERLLGIKIESSRIEAIFLALGIKILSKSESTWQVQAPSFRFDLALEADFIEEIARLYGYNNIPAQTARYTARIAQESSTELTYSQITQVLVNRGYHETITYSFVDDKVQSLLNPEQSALRLLNPLAQDMSVMRSSLWPGLLSVAQVNKARQCERVRIFEQGVCLEEYQGQWQQRSKLGALITGSFLKEQWAEKVRPVDFFDLKADLEALLDLGSLTVEWLPHPSHLALHPGQSARLECEGELLGYVGMLHPRWVQVLGLESAPGLFELDFERLRRHSLPRYQAVSKFPELRRDLAMIMDQTVPVASLRQKIHAELGECLKSLIIFDIYEGAPIEVGQKSVAIGLIFQDPQRTLVDDEINALLARVLTCLKREFKITLRT